MLNNYLVRVVLIPAGVYVSVIFGGGAATGLEFVTYLSSNGPVGGILALAAFTLVNFIVIFLCYELSRLYKRYDYRSFSKIILGKLYFLYEISLTLALLSVIAYSTTGGATALADLFGVSRHLITPIVLVLVIYLLYKGRRLIELSMMGTTVLLLATVMFLAVGTIVLHGDTIAQQLQDVSIDFGNFADRVSVYAIGATAFTPIVLFSSTELRSRTEVLVAGSVCAIALSVPGLCMHLAFLSHYPEVLEQAIPNAWIATQVMPGWFTAFFVVTLNVVILQTAVGGLQGIIEVIDAWKVNKVGKALSSWAHVGIASTCLLICLGLSAFGVQRLLGWMYDIFFWQFFAIFFVPLICVGGYKVFKAQR